jgi:WD40 repeat protein
MMPWRVKHGIGRSFTAYALAKDGISSPHRARRGVVFRVVFHPKQLMLISGGDDGDVRVWDLVTKTCTATLKVRKQTGRACPHSTGLNVVDTRQRAIQVGQ